MAERDDKPRSDGEEGASEAEVSTTSQEVVDAIAGVGEATAPRGDDPARSEDKSRPEEAAEPTADTADAPSSPHDPRANPAPADPLPAPGSTTSTDEPTSPPVERRRGGGLALLALLVSLITVAFVTYPYWPIQPIPFAADPGTLIEREAEERGRLALRIETLEASSRAVADELANTRAALTALNEISLERAQSMVALESTFNETLAQVFNGAPPSAREWRLAEAEYLLRVAGHRAVMEQDFNGALNLMVVADGVLKDLDEPQLAEVRQLLANELFSLRTAESADVSGIFLRIEALKPQIGTLPVRLPVFRNSRPTGETTDAAPGVFDRFFSLIEFRRHDVETRKPLLAPDEAEYVAQHLLAALDRAQLSALRRDDALFDASLAAAQAMLSAYLDPDHAIVQTMQAEIAALAAIELSFAAPAVGEALVRLRELRRTNDAPREGDPEPDNAQPTEPASLEGTASEALDAS